MKIYNFDEVGFGMFNKNEIYPKVGMILKENENGRYRFYCIDRVMFNEFSATPIYGSKILTKIGVLIESKLHWYMFVFMLSLFVGILLGLSL